MSTFSSEKIYCYTPGDIVFTMRAILLEKHRHIFNGVLGDLYHDFIAWSFRRAYKVITGVECDGYFSTALNESVYSDVAYIAESYMFKVIHDMQNGYKPDHRVSIVLTHERLIVIVY